MKSVSLTLFGRCELGSVPGGATVAITSKSALLLARLALPLGQSHDRKRLTELLWPDRGDVQAMASLRQSLWILRKSLGDPDPPFISADRSSVRMDPRVVEVDTVLFEQLARTGTRDDLERAVALYRGDYLADVDLDDADAQGLFLFERQRLRQLFLDCLKSLVTLRAAEGEVDGAIVLAQRSLALDPLQEDVHAAIIRIHRDAGRLGAARRQYEVCRDILRRELDIAPPDEIEALRKSLGIAAAGTASQAGSGRPKIEHVGRVAVEPMPGRLVFPRRLLTPVAALAALLVMAVVWFEMSRPELPLHQAVSDPRPSVVVLPFAEQGDDGDLPAFAQGLTYHLITDLTRVSGLFVIAADTSRAINQPDLPAQQQASKLGVDYAVTGTVTHAADGTRVSVRMVQADSGAMLWSKDYDQRGKAVLGIQDNMAREIAAALGVELTDQARRTIDRLPTQNLEAQDYFLRAEYQPTGLNEADSLRRSLAAYRRAFEVDPNFADAYAGYARVAATIWRRDVNEIMSSAMARHEAYSAAGKAMQIEPENARAYEVLSIIQAIDGEHEIAAVSARKAVDFEPGNAEAHANLANVLYIAGDIEGAAAEVDIARRLNPALPPDLRLVSGMVAFAQHHYPIAIAEFRAIQTTMPRSELVLEHLAAAYAYLGDLAKARDIAAELKQVVPIANLRFYAALSENVGAPKQTEHFIEGLRLAGIPEWPFDDRRNPMDRLSYDELRSLVTRSVWTGELANGVGFVQYFDREGGFAYGSATSLLTGRVEIRDDQLCQLIEGYLLDRPSCGYVYRAVDRGAASLAYVSIDAVKYFAVSR